MEEKVLDLHRLYDEVGILQKQLPSKRGNSKFIDIEEQVIEKATTLFYRCNTVIREMNQTDKNKYLPQVENMKVGAYNIMYDPYKKFGGVVTP